MNSSSWWSKKLGTEPAARPAPPAMPQPYQQPAPRQQPQQTVNGDDVYGSAMQWSGGEGTRTETGRCPQCGSDLYFSRSNSSSIVTQQGMAKVPPRCYACGYTDGRPMQGVPAS